jgi:hypothetical protein
MLNYLEELNAPGWLILFFIILLLTEGTLKLLSSLWSYFATKVLKISTSISRKKEIEEIILNNQKEIQRLDSEQKKDREASKEADKELREELNKTSAKLDEINSLVVSLHIDNLRVQIMDFASACRSRNYTREQYHEIFQLCEKYKVLINRYHIENGVFVVSLEIIKDRYKELDEKHGFLEDKIDQQQ